MDWKKLLAYITGSVDEELLLRNEYLAAENRILRNQSRGRLRLTDGERRTLAEVGKRLGKKALEEEASIVRPETIFGWHRRLVAKNSTAPRIGSIQGDHRSTRRSKSWWCASQRRTGPGVTIALPGPWRTSGIE
jgi:hypothetical protein